jgi:tetratricopeptide (TPR) repeat protein
MITVQILTKNNESTIVNTLESLLCLRCRIIVGDYGSTDSTLDICKKFGAEIIYVKGLRRDEARQKLAGMSKSEWNLWIEPWEILFQNPFSYEKVPTDSGYVRIINGININWEIRLWKNPCVFINPVFETIDPVSASNSSMIISSKGGPNIDDLFLLVNQWKANEPLKSQPYYYYACLLLLQEKYDEFLKVSDHYLFLEKTANMSSIMIRYYYAMVQITQKKSVRPALQNLNICLCAKPLMAEFWCLTGDVYYHLLSKFDLAKEFYENALILGSKRLNNDLWPMDVSKYKKYPQLMIDSCNQIIEKNADFFPMKNY